MQKRGLPTGVSMRHDPHYIEELLGSKARTVGLVIAIDKIEPNPEQPRTEIGDLTDLTNSIKEKGVLEPLLVKPNRSTGKWMIIAGERRWRASNLAGLTEVPCIELDIDEKSIAEIALIENLQRKDLTIWEEADGLAALASKFGYTHDEIAKKIGKSRTNVTESMSIAGLPNDIREKCHAGNISTKSVLLEISRQFDDAAMHEFVDNVINKGLSRQQIREQARPQAKVTEKSLSATHIDQAAPTKRRNFRFMPDGGDFVVEVRFNKKQVYSAENLIDALEKTIRALRK